MRNLKNAGFTLTELMVSAGVLGIVILIASGASQMMLRSATTADKVTEQVSLMSEIAGYLADPNLCTSALAGRRSQDGEDVILSLDIQSGQKYAGKIAIHSLQLKNPQQIKDDFYRADVRVQGQKSGDVVGSKDFSKTFRVFYKVNRENRISSCVGEGFDSVASCTALGGVWNDLQSRCDFCGALGAEWRDGRCQLSQSGTSSKAESSCEPELFAVKASSQPQSGNSTDGCEYWQSPIFSQTLTYLREKLRRVPIIKPADYDAIWSAYKSFYNECVTGPGLQEPSCSRVDQSGVLKWSFLVATTSLISPGQSNNGASGSTQALGTAQPRCAASILITVERCR